MDRPNLIQWSTGLSELARKSAVRVRTGQIRTGGRELFINSLKVWKPPLRPRSAASIRTSQNWFWSRKSFLNQTKPSELARTGLDKPPITDKKKSVLFQELNQTQTQLFIYLALRSALSLSTGLFAERTFCRVARASCHAARPSPMKALRVGCNKENLISICYDNHHRLCQW